MKVIGIRCTKDQLQWVVLEGSTRGDAQVVAYEEAQAPAGDRSDQLAWMRLELLEVLKAHQPDRASLRVAEAGRTRRPAFLGLRPTEWHKPTCRSAVCL
jgi:hypothetical protein